MFSEVRVRVLFVVGAVLLASAVFAPSSGANVILGIHDGSPNACDNNENWVSDGMGGKRAAPMDGPAAQEAIDSSTLINGTPWWKGLNVATVRFSVPWDIALPDSPNASDRALVTANDPSSSNPDHSWSNIHFQALKNEQTCLDWWLNAAMKAGQTAEVAFTPDYDYRRTQFKRDRRRPASTRILAPSISAYATAIRAFAAEYSRCGSAAANSCMLRSGSAGPPGDVGARVHVISPWGEPDYQSDGGQGNSLTTPRGTIPRSTEHFYVPYGGSTLDDPACRKHGRGSTDPNWCGPVLAAQYYTAVYNACGPYCELTAGPAATKLDSGIIAGDFSSGVGSRAGRVINTNGSSATQDYWRTYSQHLNRIYAWTWGLHPYNDTSDWEYCTGNGHAYPPRGHYVSKTRQFADDLASVGYRSATSIWLNEVSVYQRDMFRHSGGPSGCSGSTSYTPRREALAFQWLYRTLPTVVRRSGPQVSRVIYYRAYRQQDPLLRTLVPGQDTCLYEAIKQRDSLKPGTSPSGHC